MAAVLNPELFHKEYLEKGKRLDQRDFSTKRLITSTQNCISEAQSSSLISMGSTIVVTKVETIPQPLAPTFEISAVRAGVSQISGKASLDKTLTAMLNVLISRMVPSKELEIARPDPNDVFMSASKLWGYKLKVNTCVVSDDGGVEVAAVLGLTIALSSLMLETYSLDEEGQIHSLDSPKQLQFLPITAMRFGLLGEKLICDPTSDEEKIVDGCCTIIMSSEDKPKIMKINTTRTFLLNEDRMRAMITKCSQG